MKGFTLSKEPVIAWRSCPPLRRIRVDIGQVLEIRRQCRLAMHGDAVPGFGEGEGRCSQHGSGEEASGAKRCHGAIAMRVIPP